MVITYHGGECFKISQGDLTLAFNPPSKDSAIKVSKFGADIVLSSLDNEDFNGIETASIGDKRPFPIMGPGEYEIKGISVRGFKSDTQYGKKKGVNTIYSLSLDGINLCFLGALDGEVPQSAKQDLDDVDVLFAPIGGEGVLNYSSAYKLAVQLEPKLVIPMQYGEKELKSFLKEAGAEATDPVEKLTLKKKDLEGKEGDITVLSAN
ncbi:MAG: MBL fold metallo-hydrolase [Patescibacteria group bacterium]|nr:MBL fold metallo-hydrolase [Patescibacteria group bacterium]